MPTPTRREFIASSAATLTAASYTRAAQSPNSAIRLAIMGLRTRGRDLAPGFAAIPGVHIACLVDPDPAMANRALEKLPASAEIPIATDIRKVLEDKSITAVVVSAPDHWHALATILAAERGKHVYVEKPVSHNLIEGRRMVDAARKYKVVVQAGTQRRSASDVVAAREYVQFGKLGKVAFARTWIAGNRPNIGKAKPEEPPKGVDYDLWLGPAPAGPFTKNRFHYNWHWFWEFGTGELGNNGIHALDVARNVLGLDAPTRITCGGGKYYYDDDQETPDTQIATFEFPAGPGGAAGCTLLWEHRVWEKKGPEDQSYGIAIHGDKGTLLFKGDGWEVRGGDGAKAPPGKNIVGLHQKNFIDSIRGDAKPNAGIEEGHRSTRLCHLGNIAYRTGKVIRFDAKTETTDSPEANKLLGREYRKGFELPTV